MDATFIVIAFRTASPAFYGADRARSLYLYGTAFNLEQGFLLTQPRVSMIISAMKILLVPIILFAASAYTQADFHRTARATSERRPRATVYPRSEH